MCKRERIARNRGESTSGGVCGDVDSDEAGERDKDGVERMGDEEAISGLVAVLTLSAGEEVPIPCN